MTHAGIEIPKEYMYVLKDGRFAVDWGDGQMQDVMSGEFIAFRESEIGHPMLDKELDLLITRGRVDSYDSRHVYLRPLPEGKRQMLD
jgi:hypothetical protein